MTTTETRTRTCRRCHGTGHEPTRPEYGPQEQDLLDRMAELGAERAELQAHRAYMSASGRPRYNLVLANIRELIDQASELKIQSIDMQDALQVSPAAFYKIKNGLTGS